MARRRNVRNGHAHRLSARRLVRGHALERPHAEAGRFEGVTDTRRSVSRDVRSSWVRLCLNESRAPVARRSVQGLNGHRFLSPTVVLRRHLYPAMAAAELCRVGPTEEKRTFHSFRHTFAKRAHESGAQITWLSRHLGHSSLKDDDRHLRPLGARRTEGAGGKDGRRLSGLTTSRTELVLEKARGVELDQKDMAFFASLSYGPGWNRTNDLGIKSLGQATACGCNVLKAPATVAVRCCNVLRQDAACGDRAVLQSVLR